MNKLKEINNRATGLTDDEGFFIDVVMLDVDDYAYLFERAECVEELERIKDNASEQVKVTQDINESLRFELRQVKAAYDDRVEDIDSLEQALEFYADEDSWNRLSCLELSPIEADGGQKAIRTLKEESQ